MSDGTTWRLCAVRMTAPDELGRFAVSETVPLLAEDLDNLRRKGFVQPGNSPLMERGMATYSGETDRPEVREVLGLKPRPEFRRGEDKAHTGVAGVMG